MPNYHPSDTRQLVHSNNQIDNFALRYQRFLEEDPRSKYKLNLRRSAYKLGESSLGIGQTAERTANRAASAIC